MKKKNNDSFLINYRLKKAIAVLLATLTPVVTSGCAKNDDIDSSSEFSYVDDSPLLNDANFFGNKVSYYEYDNKELNNVIDSIKKITYKSNNSDFTNYDIYNKPMDEIHTIINNNIFYPSNPDDYPINYDWYINNYVDSIKLYNKILENNTNAGIKNDDLVKSIAEKVSIVLEHNINYIKNIKPDFNFNIALCNVNNLTVNTSLEDWYYSLYVYDNNRILVSFDEHFTDDFFKKTISHELYHLIFNGTVGLHDISFNATCMDALATHETPLEHNFLTEWCAEFFSQDTFNSPMSDNYNLEKSLIDILCESTLKPIEYYSHSMVSCDQNSLINAFEEELRDVNYVYSTFFAMDKACNYGDFPYECDLYLFKVECYNYAALNLLKNAYIKNIKEYSMNNISYEQALENIDNIKNSILNNYFFDANDYIKKSIENMDDIFYNYVNSKHK